MEIAEHGTKGPNPVTNETLTAPAPSPIRSFQERLSRLDPPRAQFVLLLVFTFLVALINGQSVTSDLYSRHVPFDVWEPWCWELTSWVGLAIAFAPAIMLDARIARRSLSPGLRFGLYLLLSVAFSVIHVATMIGLRLLVYRLHERAYDFGPLAPGLLYEYRKDLATFLVAIGLAFLWRKGSRRVIEPASLTPSRTEEPAFLAPGKDGDTLVRASDIFWVEAQGNYVALHIRGRALLVRQSLKQVQDKLQYAGFFRTHRSALINLRRVEAIRRSEVGELSVELKNGDQAPLTPGNRASFVKALSGT